MTLEKLSQITDGLIKSGRSTLDISDATTVLSDLTDQSIFISSDLTLIESAIKSKAKAILSDQNNTNHTDIAWIKVANLERSAFKITQHIIDENSASFYLFKKRELDIFKMITPNRRDIEFLDGSWQKVFEKVLNSSKRIFISSNQEMMKKLRPRYFTLEREISGYIISDTLFRSTFRIGKYVYQYKEFSPIYFDTLLRVISFCEDNELEYSLDNLRYFSGFMPIFVDGELSMNESIKDSRIFIVCDSLEDIIDAINYTKTAKGWLVKSAILTPSKTKIDSHTTPIWYNSFKDIVDILNSSNFNYAFIYSNDKNIANLLKKEYKI